MQPHHFVLDGFGPLAPDDARVGVTGDFVLAANAEAALAVPPGPRWTPLEAWARDLDLLVVTLDATFPGPDPKPWLPRVFAGPHCLDRIPRGRQTLFNMGNNHAFDGGTAGFIGLREALADRGIAVVGAGVTREEAERPWSGAAGSQLLAVHSAVHPGCHPRPPLSDGAEAASVDSASWWRRVAASVDGRTFVLVILHGGVQGSHYPSPSAIDISRRLMALGINAVVWSHAHAVQGVVPCGKGLVAYGLGNAVHLPTSGDPGRPHGDSAYDRGLYLTFAPDPAGIRHAEGLFCERRGLHLSPIEPSHEVLRWFHRLSARPQRARYHTWWRAYRLKQDVLGGAIGYLRRRSVREAVAGLRPRHLRSLLTRVGNARADAHDV